MYDYMIMNMLFISYSKTRLILTIRHFPVKKHKLINIITPAMVKLLGTEPVIAVNRQYSGREPDKQSYIWTKDQKAV